MPRAVQKATGRIKPVAFNLRTQHFERSLSFYDANLTTAVQLLGEAPGIGWGVLSISAGTLRGLGFKVFLDADLDDLALGNAHVSAMPPIYDVDGQIPQDVRVALAMVSQWVIRPDPSLV